MKTSTRFKGTLLTGIACVFILTGASCSNTGAVVGPPTPITLEWWTVYKDVEDITPLIEAYKAQYPHITINVKNLRYDTFESSLLNALAEDRGPDIFTIHNTAVQEYLPKILPMPAVTNMKHAVQKGTITKDTFTETTAVPSFSARYIANTFLDQVTQDLYFNDQLYGVPLSVDTLALFYNKALLSAAGIPLPATNYTELQEHVLKLTRQDNLGKIVQSGIAMGTGANVERFVDIISLLMMQNGTQMADSNGFALFDKLPATLGQRETLPATDALIFYTDFASPTKKVYTWNESKPNSLEAFMNGTVGYFLGYAYHRPIIDTQAPKLNYEVASMPQITGNPTINFANYWTEVVSNKTKYPDESWNFLQFITKPENARIYLTNASLPTATKTLVAEQVEDVKIGVFAEQLLTAKSWYKGKNPNALPGIFESLLNEIVVADRPADVLRRAVQKVNQTVQ